MGLLCILLHPNVRLFKNVKNFFFFFFGVNEIKGWVASGVVGGEFRGLHGLEICGPARPVLFA